MFKIEKRIIELIKENVSILFFVVITIISAIIRYTGADYVSGDLRFFLLPWFEKMKAGGGLGALSAQVGDYNLLYQTVVALLTYINAPAIYLYKAVSVCFDYALAFCVAYCLKRALCRGLSFFCAVYTAVLFLPTVILNSAFWGQCDAIYTFFILLFLFKLYSEKYLGAFVFLGLALALKLQTVFILPFVIAYYFYKKKFSILYFAVSALTFWLSGIAGFIYGRGLLEPIKLYTNQTNIYKHMWMNFPSFWRLLGDDYDSFYSLAIILTLAVCGLGLYAVMINKKKIDTPEQFFNTAAWFVWAVVLFLPAMHDRYSYLLDILLVILAFSSFKYIKYAVLSVLISLIYYGSYLCKTPEPSILLVFLYVAAFVYFSYEIFFKERNTESAQERF